MEKGNKKFGNKRVAAQKWATTTLVARTLYPPLPAEMRLAFKNTTISSYSVESAAMTLQRVSTIEPRGIGDLYPSGFPAMMQLYSKAVIDKITVKFTITPILTTATARGFPINVAGCVCPWVDTQGLGLNMVNFQRLASRPDAKTCQVGHPYASQNNNMFFSIDLRKAMANYREEHYAIKSELNGAMTLPNQATVPEAPVVCLAVFNQYAEAVGYSVQRECTYHFTFSLIHSAPMVGPAI